MFNTLRGPAGTPLPAGNMTLKITTTWQSRRLGAAYIDPVRLTKNPWWS